MKQTVKAVIKLFLFFTTAFFCLIGFNTTVLNPKYYEENSAWPTTSTYRQFYRMKRNSIDVLFLGSSVCVNAFIPQQLYDTYHIRSYNLGSEQQSPFLSYYWLKEALRFQHPEAVVFEPLFLFSLHPENPINTVESITRKCLDPMRLSTVKAEAIKDLCTLDKTQKELSYYFTNIRFHTRWKSVTRADFRPEYVSTAPLKGYSDSYDNISRRDNYVPFEEKNINRVSSMTDLMKIYLDKIRDLCDKNGIDLILVSTPNIINDIVINEEIHISLKEYADLNHLKYFNLGEKYHYEQMNIVSPKEIANGHANVWGAIKITDYIGKILTYQFAVPSVVDSQWEDSEWYFQKILLNAQLRETTDLHEYLRLLGEGNYSVFISAKDKALSGLNEPLQKDFEELGIQTNLKGKIQSSFYAIITPDSVKEQISGTKSLSAEGNIHNNQIPYSITSAGADAGNKSSIKIDGKEYSKSMRGLNIVVYDNDIMRVVDSVNFDTSSDAIPAKR